MQYLKENQDKYNIKRACKTLSISRSGFYEYLNRKPSKRMLENEPLSTEIRKIFEEHKGRYGSIRIPKTFGKKGILSNRKRVSKLMRNMKLYPRGTRYRYKRYNQKSASIERPNLLNQSFQTDDKNKIWVGDITYVPTKKGVLYLAVFLDIYSRKVSKEGLIVHTDQGSQFTSGNFQALLCTHSAVSSVSRKRNPMIMPLKDLSSCIGGLSLFCYS